MTTVKEAQETTIYVINNVRMPMTGESIMMVEETNLYDHVMNFKDENYLTVEYVESIETDEEDNEIDNGKFQLRYHPVNGRSKLLTDGFETEEDAEDEIFNRIYNYDFERSNENTSFFYSKEDCEDDILCYMEDAFYNEYGKLDKEVVKSIRAKELRLYDARKIQDAIHTAKANKAYNERKEYLATAVPAEAESIEIDGEFIECIKKLSSLSGEAKSKYSASLMKALLERNGKEKVESDFWQVFRILKANAEKM